MIVSTLDLGSNVVIFLVIFIILVFLKNYFSIFHSNFSLNCSIIRHRQQQQSIIWNEFWSSFENSSFFRKKILAFYRSPPTDLSRLYGQLTNLFLHPLGYASTPIVISCTDRFV